jgi:transposase
MALTDTEIKKRLIRLSNLEKLHTAQLKQNEKLRRRNKDLKARVSILEITLTKQNEIITTLKLQVEELQQIIFGKKQKKKDDTDGTPDSPNTPPKEPEMRTVASYSRRVPTDSEVTKEGHHSISNCPDCGEPLTKKTTIIHYEEDIILPTKERTLKEVTRHTTDKGWCTPCKRWHCALAPPYTKVTLGANVRAFVSYASVNLRLSYSQIQTQLNDLYNFSLSDGEISNILRKEATLLNPEYERIKRRIDRQAGAHYDETGWGVQNETQGNYAWVRVGTETNDTLFLCGQSRGGGNIDKLRNNKKQIGISDDYGVYTNAFKKHELCWSHPNRKLRDLAESGQLTPDIKQHCIEVYTQFSQLYDKIQETRDTPFILSERQEKCIKLMEQFDAVTIPHQNDPQKLVQIKKRLRQRKECYFVCITNEGIPPDNNKAERALRHLVLKRKMSFGSKTQAGADTLSILASVLLTLQWKQPTNFFQEYLKLRTQKMA